MMNKKLISCVIAVSMLAGTAVFCSSMGERDTECESKDSAVIGFQNVSDTPIIRTSSIVSGTFPTGFLNASSYIYLDDVPLSRELQGVMQDACAENNVPYSLALAITEIESGFDVDADNGLCVGLMQINRCNHEWLKKLGIDPTEYAGNIKAGVYMIGKLLERHQDVHKALMEYNCGDVVAERLWEQGYLTSTYSCNVVAVATAWQVIIEKNLEVTNNDGVQNYN